MAKDLKISLRDVPDESRRPMEQIRDYLLAIPLLSSNFELVEIEFSAAVSNFKYPHHRGFVPQDVIQTRLTGAGAITWNYALFDRDFLDITVSGACKVRAFVGSYGKVAT